MDVFENLKDIEKIYADLINNAKNRNLKDIEQYRDDQQKIFETFIEKKNALVNDTLGRLTKEVNIKVKNFEDLLDKALHKIELRFQKKIENLEKLIIHEVGFDF